MSEDKSEDGRGKERKQGEEKRRKETRRGEGV